MIDMITEDYVSFEIAKLLKEKGFVVPYDSFRGVYINGEFLRRNPGQGYLHNMGDEIIEVCSIQMAMKWLREIHKLGVFPSTYMNICGSNTTHVYGTAIVNLNTYELMTADFMARDTYNEACEVAIKYCLENLI